MMDFKADFMGDRQAASTAWTARSVRDLKHGTTTAATTTAAAPGQ